MKVYTHYYPIANSEDGFRWRTLLQFGESWDVIGSVVMKNPGSANFLYPDRRNVTDAAVLNELRKFDNADTANDNWYEFSVDNTMTCIGNLFSLHHKYAGSPLNGVIQIFNIFYLREADFGKGLAKSAMFKTPEKMTQYDIENLIAPVYLGFSNLAHHKVYATVAKQFFEKALDLGMNYLNKDFNNNAFIHPQYLMMYGKYKPHCVLDREQFLNC